MSIAEAVTTSKASAKKRTNIAEESSLPPLAQVVRLVMSGK
jgi:hypothetical protein